MRSIFMSKIKYSKEFKLKVLKEHEEGASFYSLKKKYGIHAESTVLKWVKQYNSHVELTDSRKIGGYLMTKDIKPRKTTLEERIRIVEYCIANSNDYSAAAKAYNCSYGQVYSWVKKYEADGVDGLKDGRGRIKPEEELSEMEKLKAENRLLRAEKFFVFSIVYLTGSTPLSATAPFLHT